MYYDFMSGLARDLFSMFMCGILLSKSPEYLICELLFKKGITF